MNLNQLIDDLSLAGVKLSADGDELRVRAPKGVLTQQRRDLLTLQKAELVSLLRYSHDLSAHDTQLPLVRVSREQHLLLSFPQQQMWFFNQLEPSNPFYNIIYVAEEVRQSKLLGSDFRLVEAQLFCELVRIQTLAILHYRPKHYPGRVTLLRAEEHKQVSLGPANR